MIIKQSRDSFATIKLELPKEEDPLTSPKIDFESSTAGEQNERRVQIIVEEKP